MILFIAINLSCDKEDLFKQPSIEVIGYTLEGLPGEYTTLNVDVLVTNNDSKEPKIKDVEYTVTVEGFESQRETIQLDQKVLSDEPLEVSLPLTLKTKDAIQLLAKLDKGEELSYTVDGIFHIDKSFLDVVDWPLDLEGTALIDVGFEEYYNQPEITVVNVAYSYSGGGLTNYTFNLDVNCTVKNVDTRDVEIDEVEYTAIIEGVKSETHLYSSTYESNLIMAAGETINLKLPVTLELGVTSGLALVTALSDGNADYVIEGTFHAIKVDLEAADFLLPLYVEGTVPASALSR